ncbi:MAG: hypothetical protein Q7R52_03525 [archaeon]|nr:hypothetical protein [archaeon]
MAKKRKREVKTSGSKNCFMLTWKKFVITLIIWLVAVLLHNFVSGMFQYEEAIFFVIAIVLIPAYLVIAALYTVIKRKKK